MLHSNFPPSSSHRWINCPHSVVNIKAESKTNPMAEIGTALHWLYENQDTDELVSPNGILLEAHHSKLITETNRQLKLIDYGYIRYSMRVNISRHVDYLADIWGTTDLVIFNDSGIHIVDLKFGRWDVDAKNNYQLLTYAVGLLDMIEDEVHLHICQPTTSDELKSWTVSRQQVLSHRDRIRVAAQLAISNPNQIFPGKWCRFCPKEKVCPKG